MAARRKKSLNVLFIGNSFTERNDVPALIGAIAAARGRSLTHSLISAGGASLRRHWNKGEARAAIETGEYDFVVLQEQSTLPIKNAARMQENVRLFNGVITNAGAKTVLYMTWARQHAPESQKTITDAYTAIATELDAALAPVGAAWAKLLRRSDAPTLHDADGSHPTIAGSYLAACVLFGVLFNESPADAAVVVDGVSDDDAARLQNVAASVLPA